jgi:phosphatidylethanolamine-binding protein (PEBP) family uncharacterized protein
LANPPAGTKSFALLMFDPEGRPPGGVSHWVAYGIAPTVTGFAEGEASKQTDKYVGGKSLMNLPHYFGPCTPPGPPHHYMFTLMATDLEPNALQSGMTRGVLEAVVCCLCSPSPLEVTRSGRGSVLPTLYQLDNATGAAR